VIDLLGTLEVGTAIEELRREVDGLWRRSGSVAGAECRSWRGGGGAALTSGGREMLTAFGSKDGFGGFGIHGLTFLGLVGTPTRVFLEKRLQAVENKGNGS